MCLIYILFVYWGILVGVVEKDSVCICKVDVYFIGLIWGNEYEDVGIGIEFFC